MGKRSRRRARELSARSPSATPLPGGIAEAGTVHITVAATAGTGELDLGHETQLVKAGLLYATK
jgi:hypothetical protein